MKINISSLALMAITSSSTANAWSFYLGGETVIQDIHDDIECGLVYGAIGDNIKFYEGLWEDCRLSLYLDGECEELFASLDDEGAYTLKDEMWSYSAKCGS